MLTGDTIDYSDRLEPEDKPEWLSGMGSLPHMLYRLPGLVAADPARVVFVVEGEKDADTLFGLGLTATTNSSGAGKWLDEYSEHLSGRDVVILPDNDVVGRDHAAKVLRSVHTSVCSVKIIELDDLPAKGDVSDWIKAGHTKEELLNLVAVAQPIADPDEWHSVNAKFIMGIGGKTPLGSPGNAYLALDKMGVRVNYDEFAGRYNVKGLPGFGPRLEDAGFTRLRLEVEKRFGINYAKDRWIDIVTDHARRHAVHPVREYLDGLCWDGQPRLDRWLIDYGGAEDNPYVRTVGALVLIAAVRRVRHPGVKFDQMLVLEGPQGSGKSSALAILAVKESWFTDEMLWDTDTRTLMERFTGRWIIEAAELNGMRKTEVEKFKAILSRQIDSSRVAYGRMTTELPRQCVIFGTTNNNKYLNDMTGNRRVWPVKVGFFNLDLLRRDRDQIWAEVSKREQSGQAIELPKHLWAVAAEQQNQRVVIDPFEQIIFGPLLELDGFVQSENVWKMLGLADQAKRTQLNNKRLNEVMTRHGWSHTQKRIGGQRPYGYMKGVEGGEVPLDKLFPAVPDIM